MARLTMCWALASCLASAAFAQPAPREIRATGERAVRADQDRELARRLAFADARSRVLRQTVTGVQALTAVRALKLTPLQLEAFIPAIVDVEETAARPAAETNVHRVTVRVSLDPESVVPALKRLRTDQDTAATLLGLQARITALYRRLTVEGGRAAATSADGPTAGADGLQQAVAHLDAAFLAAQATAALARTEESTVGGRVTTGEGRARARRRAEAAVLLAPDSPDARYSIGDLLLDARQPADAEREYRRALQLQPESSAGHVKLAAALRLQGRLSESVAKLRTAIRLDPRSALAHSDLALVLQAQRNVTEAAAEYEEALRLDADVIDAHNGLAVILAGRGRLAEAAAQFREITRVDPDSAIGYYNLASVLADLDQDAESAAALREVIRINPAHYNAHYNLGELFRLEGKYDESSKQFREYVRLAPDTPQNRRNIQRARELVASFENP